jgi:cell division protein FtsL
MKRSLRGSAKVSVIWLVGLIVVFLIALVMFFLTNEQATQAQADIVAKDAKIAQLEKDNKDRTKQILDISSALGFTDPANPSASDLDAAGKARAEALKAIPDADQGAKDYQSLTKSLIPIYAAKDARIKDLQSQLDTAVAEGKTVGARMNESLATAEKEKNDLRQQLQDTENRLNDTKTDLERRVAEATELYKTSDNGINKLKQELADSKATFETEKLSLQTRMDEQGRKLNSFVKEPERADAKVLQVSKDLGLAWIDIGSKERLAAGMKFRMVSGARGSKQVKGWCEVTEVKSGMAEVRLYDQVDPLDPPVAGDVVFNPLFDPRGERAALLIGRMDRNQIEPLLKGMGMTVQTKLDKSTDFLIVGGEMYTDENNQPVETPIQPSDLPVYKDAVAQGVQIVLVKDLRQYFTF